MSDEKKVSPHTERKAGAYLFDTPEDDDQALDMRTRVRTEDGMRALLYLGVLHEAMDSDVAGQVKGIMERLFIAYQGQGRAEAVDVLRQSFPKKIEVEKGIESISLKGPDE